MDDQHVLLVGCLIIFIDDAPPSSLIDSTMSPKVKTMEGKGVGVRPLARSILRVERHAEASR